MQINKSSLGYYYHLKSGLLPVGWNNYESLGNLQQASRAAPAGCFTALLQCNTVPREQNLNQLLILIDINCRKQFARFDGSFFFLSFGCVHPSCAEKKTSSPTLTNTYASLRTELAPVHKKKCCFGFITTSPATFLTLKQRRHLTACSGPFRALHVTTVAQKQLFSHEEWAQVSYRRKGFWLRSLRPVGSLPRKIVHMWKAPAARAAAATQVTPHPHPSPLSGCRSVLLCFDFTRLIMWCCGSGCHSSCRTTGRCDHSRLEAQMQMSLRECAALLLWFFL